MDTNAIICLILTIFLSIIAICFRKGKLLFLLAGYNTASKEEKENIDKVKMGRYFSVVIGGTAIICFSYMLYFIFRFSSLISDTVTFIVLIFVIVFLIKNRK